MLPVFNLKFSSFFFYLFTNKKASAWNLFFNRSKLTKTESWAYRVLTRRDRFFFGRLNYRIFFSKRNKFFKNFFFTLTFSRGDEKRRRLKKQNVFFVFLCLLYGFKRKKKFKAKLSFVKRARLKLSRLENLIVELERRLLVVIIRMSFTLNYAWAVYLISKGLVFLNGIFINCIGTSLNLGDLISINLLEYLNLVHFKPTNKMSNFFRYCMWLYGRLFIENSSSTFNFGSGLIKKKFCNFYFNFYRETLFSLRMRQFSFLNFFIQKLV